MLEKNLLSVNLLATILSQNAGLHHSQIFISTDFVKICQHSKMDKMRKQYAAY